MNTLGGGNLNISAYDDAILWKGKDLAYATECRTTASRGVRSLQGVMRDRYASEAGLCSYVHRELVF